MIDMIRPSGSHQWDKCRGSQLMQTGMPDDETDAAKEGTACHWIASEILESYVNSTMEVKTATDFLDKLAPNDVYIDEEMIEGAMMYVQYILDYSNRNGSLQNTHVEEKINLDSIYPGMSGTPDCWIYNPNVPEIVLLDLKYGHGYVDEFENPQLMIYAKGIMDYYQIDGVTDQHIDIRMVIVQPRSFSDEGAIREWKIKGSDLRPYVNQLKTSAHIAMDTNDITTCESGTHCRYCRARQSCTVLQKTVYNAIDVIESPVHNDLAGNDLAFELHLLKRMKDLLDYRISAVETQVETEIKGGKLLPGFSLKQGYGRKKWTKDKGLLKFMDSMGVDIRKPDAFITPTQALTKLKAIYKKLNFALDDNVISKYTEVPMGKMKVVEDDPNLIRKIFAKGNQ